MTTPRQRETLQISGSGGWRANFRGSTGALIFTLIAAIMGAVAYRSDATASDREQRIEQKAAARHNEVLQAIRESNESIVYVLSLPMEERERLRLTMPASIRAMQEKKQ